MRILVLTTDYPPGVWSGVGRAVAHQTRALAALGHQVDVGVVGPAGGTGGGVRVRSLDLERFPFDLDAFDVLHLHSLALAEPALQIRRRCRRPLVYTAHSLVHRELSHPRARPWGAAQVRLLRESDRVIFPSRSERTAATELEPSLRVRGFTLANGLPTPPEAPAPRAETEGPIVFAGRFAPSKGVELLAEIAERMLRAGEPRTFVLAGGHGDAPCHRRLERLAARYPSRFQLAGWLDQRALQRLLARASLVLIPSRYEPFGMVAVEAMALGTPVLGAAVDGLAEVLAPGSGGRCLGSGRAQDWVTAVRGILRDRTLRRRLSDQGPQWVGRRYHSEPLARRLVEHVYRPLVAGFGGKEAFVSQR